MTFRPMAKGLTARGRRRRLRRKSAAPFAPMFAVTTVLALWSVAPQAHALPKVDMGSKLQAARELLSKSREKLKSAHAVIETEIKPGLRNEIRKLKRNWATDRIIKQTPQLVPVFKEAMKKHGKMKRGDWQSVLVGTGILALFTVVTQDYTNAIIFPTGFLVGTSAMAKLMRMGAGWPKALRETIDYADDNGILPYDNTQPPPSDPR